MAQDVAAVNFNPRLGITQAYHVVTTWTRRMLHHGFQASLAASEAEGVDDVNDRSHFDVLPTAS